MFFDFDFDFVYAGKLLPIRAHNLLQHVDIGKVISIVIVLQLSVSSHWDESIPYIHDNSLLEYSS